MNDKGSQLQPKSRPHRRIGVIHIVAIRIGIRGIVTIAARRVQPLQPDPRIKAR